MKEGRKEGGEKCGVCVCVRENWLGPEIFPGECVAIRVGGCPRAGLSIHVI